MIVCGGRKNAYFFNLEYWKYLLVRNQLYTEHFDKSKDGLKSKMDLVALEIKVELEPK